MPSDQGSHLGDMLLERETILNRIEALQLEILKEQKDLTALDVILSRLMPQHVPKTAGGAKAPRSDFVDADFEVIPRGSP